jgi:hypothetical protein
MYLDKNKERLDIETGKELVLILTPVAAQSAIEVELYSPENSGKLAI